MTAETIQGRKLFKGGNYSRKYGTFKMAKMVGQREDSVDDSPSIPIRNSTWVRIPARAGKWHYPNKVRVVPFTWPSIQNDVVRSKADSIWNKSHDGVVSLENHNFLKMIRNYSTWLQFYHEIRVLEKISTWSSFCRIGAFNIWFLFRSTPGPQCAGTVCLLAILDFRPIQKGAIKVHIFWEGHKILRNLSYVLPEISQNFPFYCL